MKIDTYLFGKVDVSEQALINFPDGLPGFEQCKTFALIHEAADKNPTSFTLQSVDDAQVAFQIADPTAYGFHYELQLSDEETQCRELPCGGNRSHTAIQCQTAGRHKPTRMAPV